MRAHHKPAVPKKLAVLILLLIVFAAVSFPVLRTRWEIYKLERLLSDVSIKSLTVDGKSYSVKNGAVSGNANEETALAVLRLGAFYEWNKEDPLFDSPDFDPQKLKDSLGVLDDSQKQLLSVIGQKQMIFPVNFLNSFADASSSDKDFLSQPSDNSGRSLLRLQKEAAGSYIASAGSFLAFLGHPPDIYTTAFNIQTSQKVVDHDYQAVVQNGASLESEIQKRESCLKGEGDCVRPLATLTKPVLEDTAEKGSVSLLPKDLIKKQMYVGTTQFPVDGPFRADTACFGWGDNFSLPEHYFYLIEAPSSPHSMGKPYLDVMLATDIFYRRITDIEPSSPPMNRILLQMGQTYAKQNSSAPYMCTNTSYINEIVEVHKFLTTQKPILQNTSAFNDAKVAEKRFFTDPYPSFGELSNLGDFYGYLYKTDSLPPQRDELLRRYLAIKNKLGDLDSLMIREVPYTLRARDDEIMDPLRNEVVFNFIYPFRSNYGLMYFPFSPAVWRSSASPSYMQQRKVINAVSPQGGYISYTQAVKLYPKDVIESWSRDLNPILDQINSKGSSD